MSSIDRGISFEVGAWVVYPSHGVGLLDRVDRIDIDGTIVEFFVISFPRSKLELKLPVKRAVEAGLRGVVSKSDMEEVLGTLVQKTKKRRLMWSKRAQEYESKINSGDPVAIAEVVRELYRGDGEVAQSFSERQLYKHALERLAREVSVIDEIEESDAIKKLESILQAA
ncbi:MAG: CarD family transcriptional regulator [Holosporales bacterium]|jgi:CarD family transcriptional regulator|nr:CarD family transcriptional regulator [Holosporales bacterium]